MRKRPGRPTARTESQENRKVRVPFGAPKLTLSLDEQTMNKLKSEDKVPYFFKDDPNNIKRALEAWYEFVYYDDVKLGDAQSEQEERVKVTKTGKDGVTLVLMAIPRKYYDEDRASKEAHNAKVDQAIRGGAPGGLQPHGIHPSKGGTSVKNVSYKP